MDENVPVLVSFKTLKHEFKKLQEINITSDNFTLGRGLQNSIVVPFLAISRNHCTFSKHDNSWFIEDTSSFGIEVNGVKVGKGNKKKLSHDDKIKLEPSEEFVYRFIYDDGEFEIPRKRIKLEKVNDCHDIIKMKFEESQSFEIQYIEQKIQTAKQLQTQSVKLEQQLHQDMNKKIAELEHEFAAQIENLQGEKNEVERQKALLIEERDSQLESVKEEMDGKILELRDQIKKHTESESELIKENNQLKDKLLKEREEFLSELSRESSSKQDMLKNLEAKLQEQEEVRQKEKRELEEMLQRETEILRLAKEKELKELEEQKRKRELELEEELQNIKKSLEERVEQTEQQRLKAEQMLSEQTEQMKKLSDEERNKMEQIVQEREEIKKKLLEAQKNAEKSLEVLSEHIKKREVELASLAADRIQKQAEQSSEVISSLQVQLEQVRNQLQSVECERRTLLENICQSSSTSGTEGTLARVGELVESELQCAVCAELLVEPTTLACSHTYCKHCLEMWKRKKKDCPICRAPITSQCRSLVLETFIEKIVQNLTEDMKLKREELLKHRKAEMEAVKNSTTTTQTSGRRPRRRRTTTTTTPGTVTVATVTTATVNTTRTIPTVDLTMAPIPSVAPRPPTVALPAIFHLPGRAVVLMGPDGRTTAAMGAATAAAREATGRPAAHSADVTTPHRTY